jgi:hypothetical protein
MIACIHNLYQQYQLQCDPVVKVWVESLTPQDYQNVDESKSQGDGINGDRKSGGYGREPEVRAVGSHQLIRQTAGAV